MTGWQIILQWLSMRFYKLSPNFSQTTIVKLFKDQSEVSALPAGCAGEDPGIKKATYFYQIQKSYNILFISI